MKLNITPVAKPRMTRADVWKKRPCVLKYRAFCDELRLLTDAAGYVQADTLEVVFVMPMPKSWSKKKKAEMKYSPMQSKPDIDNLVKAFLDALLKEDSHVHSIYCSKIWGTEGAIYLN